MCTYTYYYKKVNNVATQGSTVNINEGVDVPIPHGTKTFNFFFVVFLCKCKSDAYSGKVQFTIYLYICIAYTTTKVRRKSLRKTLFKKKDMTYVHPQEKIKPVVYV